MTILHGICARRCGGTLSNAVTIAKRRDTLTAPDGVMAGLGAGMTKQEKTP
jgi:hypothetical protein